MSWLGLLQTSPVDRVFVLCDTPEMITLPPKPVCKLSTNDRATFVRLAKELEGTAGPVVAILWGHGGRQGATPVLHVRGLRLVPADLRDVAEKTQDDSYWVLCFNGSGAFARELAGPKRQIISSEFDTVFNSDPIGMNVLLKVARARSDASFLEVAREFGKMTAGWYSDRSLARTEEPTLWLPDEKPKLLAREEGNGVAEDRGLRTEGNPKPEIRSPKSEMASEDIKPKEHQREELPAAWKEIKLVAVGKYPDADAVSLRRRASFTLGSNPAVVCVEEEFIQILAAEGKRHGDFDISYSPPGEDLSFLDCEVLRPDGELVALDPDAIRDGAGQSLGEYQAGRRKFFSLPAVIPGAVLHVRYKRQWKEFPFPHISLGLPVTSEIPSVDSTIRVSVPKDKPFHFALAGMTAADPEVSQSSYASTYTWRFRDLPAERHEVLVSPEHTPKLMLSMFPDWAALAEWYQRMIRLADEITPDIAAKAKELVQSAKTDREKVVAIYNYVAGLRYVAVPLGVNSFRPHAAANVLKNQYGDCKDKANLFNALLRSLDFESELVLVPRFNQAYDGIPGFAFNHAMSRLRLDGKELWVDTTDDVCRFGMLPPGDPGRKVLVIDGKTTALTQLPIPEASDHSLTLRGRLKCSSPGEPVAVSISVVTLGFPDYVLRTIARETRDHATTMPLLAAAFRPVSGALSLKSQEASQVSALDENFSWRGEGLLIGLTSQGGGGEWWLRAPFWTPREWDHALHERKSPLFLNQGYPLTLEQEFELALPEETHVKALPVAAENREAPLRWRVEWENGGENKVVARFHAELMRGELSAGDTPLLQKQLCALVEAFAAGASLSPWGGRGGESGKKAKD